MGLNRNLAGFGGSANISGFVANTQITGLITAPQIAPSAIPAGGFSNMQVFTSPGNFTIPPTTTKLKVTVVGGGAGQPGRLTAPPGQCIPVSFYAAAGAGASGGVTSFGSYQTATGGSISASGTAPGADLIIDGACVGKYGSSYNFSPNNFAGMGGYGVKIISAPFPVTLVPVTIGNGGGGGGSGGAQGYQLCNNTCAGAYIGTGTAGSPASGVNGGAGGNGAPVPAPGPGPFYTVVGAGGGGGGGASGSSVGNGGAGGTKGTGGTPANPLAPGPGAVPNGAAGTPGTGPFNRIGGGLGGGYFNNPANIGINSGGAGGHSGIVIVEF